MLVIVGWQDVRDALLGLADERVEAHFGCARERERRERLWSNWFAPPITLSQVSRTVCCCWLLPSSLNYELVKGGTVEPREHGIRFAAAPFSKKPKRVQECPRAVSRGCPSVGVGLRPHRAIKLPLTHQLGMNCVASPRQPMKCPFRSRGAGWVRKPVIGQSVPSSGPGAPRFFYAAMPLSHLIHCQNRAEKAEFRYAIERRHDSVGITPQR